MMMIESEHNKISYETARNILNTLTPENYSTAVEKFKNLNFDSIEQLRAVIDLIHQKSIDEPDLCKRYAKICSIMQDFTVVEEENWKLSFTAFLLNKCQNFFESENAKKLDVGAMQAEINACVDPLMKNKLLLELEEKERETRRQNRGNCRFIGELFKLKMLTPRIMLNCTRVLINQASEEESLECLCVLLAAVGKNLDEKLPEDMDVFFKRLSEIAGSTKPAKISSRVHFMILDVIDARKNNWLVRPEESTKTETVDKRKNVQMNMRKSEIEHDNLMMKKSSGDYTENEKSSSQDDQKGNKSNGDMKSVLNENITSEFDAQNNSTVTTDKSASEEDFCKAARNILSTLRPGNYHTTVDKFQTLEINSHERLMAVVNLIHQKAIDEPDLCKLYAKICSITQDFTVVAEKHSKRSFRALLLNKCQSLFESKVDVEAMQAEIDVCTGPEEKSELQLTLQEKMGKARRQNVGNCRFIGELFKLKMLTPTIMLNCIRVLINQASEEESLECSCVLLAAVGKNFDERLPSRKIMDRFFEQLSKIAESTQTDKMSSRVRFMVLNLIDARKNEWVLRPEKNTKTVHLTVSKSHKDHIKNRGSLRDDPLTAKG